MPEAAAPCDWRAALLAGACLDAAAGVVAGAAALCFGAPFYVAFFGALAVASALTGSALVPGWLWTDARFDAAALLWRFGATTAFLSFGAVVGFVLGMTIVLIPLSFLVAAALGGLGASVAEGADWRQGRPGAPAPTRPRVHVLGALAGVVLTLAGAAVFAWGDRATSQVPALGAALRVMLGGGVTLAVASAPHRWMQVHELRRRTLAPPAHRLLAARARRACGILAGIALCTLVLAFVLPHRA